MLKMRLQRTGRKNDASFRVVVTDSRRGPKSGKHVDLLGSYNPKLNQVQIDGEKAKEWIAKGVQVSDTLHNLLVGQNIIEGKKINVLPKKSPLVSEQAEAEGTETAASTETESEGDADTEEKKEEVETEAKEEVVPETPTEEKEEVKEDSPSEEKPTEDKKE